MMSKLNTDEKIRNKDIRNLSLEFNVKDFDAKNDSGIKLNAKFAIANINNDPINAQRALFKLDIKQKQSHICFRIKVNTQKGKTMDQMVYELK